MSTPIPQPVPTIAPEVYTPSGGDSHTYNVNTPYIESNTGYHAVWIMAAGAIVWMIVPGLGLLYSGLSRRKSAASMLYLCLAVSSVITFQWFLWGYSLTFGDGSVFLGTMEYVVLKDAIAEPSGYIPSITFCFYQGMFCLCTVMILVGGVFERCRMLPTLLYSFCWATVVYCPIAYWTWNADGWLATLGALDFAGGGPVHITSGVSGLAIAWLIGKRYNEDGTKKEVQHTRPHNVTLIFLGTILIWFGWFGFNGGSTGNASVRAAYALVNTNLAAATGMMTWTGLDMLRYKGRVTISGASSGVIAGLVGITPAAGYVPVYFGAVIGMLASLGCYASEPIYRWLHIDEGLDVFKLHGIGGIIGAIFTGVFANDFVSLLDGSTDAQGWVNHHWKQVGYQFAEVTSICAWAFVVSAILFVIMDHIPYLHFRLSKEDELLGQDFFCLEDELMGDYALTEMILPSAHRTTTIQGQYDAEASSTAELPGTITPPIKPESHSPSSSS